MDTLFNIELWKKIGNWANAQPGYAATLAAIQVDRTINEHLEDVQYLHKELYALVTELRATLYSTYHLSPEGRAYLGKMDMLLRSNHGS